jgi:UDPglucose 6-dehydrogenase
MKTSPFKIAVVGLWHLGEIYSAGLAELGHSVVGISDDKKVVADLSRNIPPLPEPRLEELIVKYQTLATLRYATDFSEAASCNTLWLTLDTPVNDEDESNLAPIWDALNKSLPHLRDGVLIAVSSQLPVGTSEKIISFVRNQKPKLNFGYVYTPENLRLGEAVKCFLEPSRIVAGVSSEAASNAIQEIFSPLKTEIIRMSPASAEMAKHALNAFLATSVSFINDIADACEKSGADVLDVARALRSDSRVGPRAFLDAGLGFSGGTLGRDLVALMQFSKERGFAVPVIEAAFRKNRGRANDTVQKISRALGNLHGKTIAIFGLTYKPGTRTLRRSRALEIAAELEALGATLRLHDPAVQEEELPSLPRTSFHRDPYEAARGTNALIFATPWPEFKKLDLKKLLASTERNAILWDTANLFYDERTAITELGITYIGTGL